MIPQSFTFIETFTLSRGTVACFGSSSCCRCSNWSWTALHWIRPFTFVFDCWPAENTRACLLEFVAICANVKSIAIGCISHVAFFSIALTSALISSNVGASRLDSYGSVRKEKWLHKAAHCFQNIILFSNYDATDLLPQLTSVGQSQKFLTVFHLRPPGHCLLYCVPLEQWTNLLQELISVE